MHHPALLVVLACLLDRLVGDPRRCLHPVQVMGWAIQGLRHLSEAWAGDTPWKLRLAGVAITLLVCAGSGVTGWQLEQWALERPLLGTGLVVVALASALAGRSLEQAVRQVLSALPDLQAARDRLGWIVGREVNALPEAEILRAAAETTAENAVDGLFAPLFWMLIGVALAAHWSWAPGPLALAWIFKAGSTLDSMLGYRHGRLRWLGTAGARLDDGLTWVPARLVALTLPLLSSPPRRWWGQFQRALWEGASDPSPNAGVSQAAYAHAVGVQLGGWNRYADGWRLKPLLGQGFPCPDGAAVQRMLQLTLELELGWMGIALAVAGLWSCWRMALG
ncbi:MAG: adenosylcobinamide-phosphate synthase CbiB [Cyanobacteriota bacterium]|nr:adenosylcobinamide-phosphate synthase CbiB [Cyanobacteriota bacterium]